MAVTAAKLSAIVATLGIISFILGVVAENKKPSSGTPIKGDGVVICKYPTDPTVALGYLSFGFLVASSIVGCISAFYPYKGTSVPCAALFKYKTFYAFFTLALAMTVVAAGMTLWPTITEQHHLAHNVQHIKCSCYKPECPTAKTGLLGGAAFLSLNASLFWLACLMLVNNAREDYLHQLDRRQPSSLVYWIQ